MKQALGSGFERSHFPVSKRSVAKSGVIDGVSLDSFVTLDYTTGTRGGSVQGV